MSRTASLSRSLPRCWPCLPARLGRDGIASSCLSSTTPAGTPNRTWLCRMGSGSSTCPHTPPSFSPPSTSGPSSTSHWPTSPSTPSPISNAPSQTVAGSSMAVSSVSGQTSTGGPSQPSQPSRPNQPEFVMSPKLNRIWFESDTADVHGGLPVVPNLRRDRRKLVMVKEEHGICSSKLSRRSSEGLIGGYNGQISSNELLRGDHLLDGFIANWFRIEFTLDDNASTATLSNYVRALIAATLRHLG